MGLSRDGLSSWAGQDIIQQIHGKEDTNEDQPGFAVAERVGHDFLSPAQEHHARQGPDQRGNATGRPNQIQLTIAIDYCHSQRPAGCSQQVQCDETECWNLTGQRRAKGQKEGHIDQKMHPPAMH